MKETDIRSYAGLMQEFGLTGLEITEDNRVVRLERNIPAGYAGEPGSLGGQCARGDLPAQASQPVLPLSQSGGLPAGSGMEQSRETSRSVTSPMVGVFYAAPAENADPYVAVGDRVRKGQTLCMVEAMKLMNEITAEEDGVIDQILVANGQVVEYGTELFRLKRA